VILVFLETTMPQISVLRTGFLLITLGWIVTACGGTRRVYTHYDPAAASLASEYRTFDWLAHPGGEDLRPGAADLTAEVVRITEAALATKGYNRLDAAPEFHMGWHYVTEPTHVTTINSYYGYTWGRWFPGGGVSYGAGYRSEFPAGTVILDAVDAATRELVWRGFALVASIDDPLKRDEELTEVIARMLLRFPRP
jgi:hypothetical protein